MLKSAASTRRKLHCATCSQNCRYFSQPSQLAAHLARASEVKATARPRPYCQWASSGSPFCVTSGTSARALGRGADIAQQAAGYSAGPMPLTNSLDDRNCGLNGSSKMADFKMTEASLMKICGKSDGGIHRPEPAMSLGRQPGHRVRGDVAADHHRADGDFVRDDVLHQGFLRRGRDRRR